MNAQRKKAAVAAYAHLLTEGKSNNEIMDAISEDEKEYTVEEINEIVAAITAPQSSKEEDKATGKSKPKKVVEFFEEWKVDVKVSQNKKGENERVYEKLKLVRPVVKITEEEAEILNTGLLNGPNTSGLMYFRPEEK